MIDIELSKFDRLALLYSGGADSALLYYLVATYLLKSNTKFTLDLLIVDRYNKPIEKAISLYQKIKERINDNTSSLKIVTLPDSTPGHLQVIKVVEQEQKNYDAILWGVNKYPSDITIRPKNEFTVDFKRFSNHPKLKLPFEHFSKVDIIKTFFDLGLTDILDNTHSCGRPVELPCGECFNCRERAWAYQQLGMEPNLGI